MCRHDDTSPPLSLRKILLCSSAALLFLVSVPALSELDTAALHQAAVRVEANDHFASGFLYGGKDRVVTSLHAILPPPQTIEIYCNGNAVEAKVVKYLKDADLVLLEATSSLEKLGCKPYPKMKKSLTKPKLGADLVAFGFREDNRRSAFAKTIKGGSGPPLENLETLISDTAVKTIRKIGMPKSDLPLYLISGALYPGLSGAPVFLIDTGELVAIVEGGLDAGVTHHAWLAPVSNLEKLLASPDNSTLPNIDPSKYGYSSSSARRTADNYVEYSDPDASYSWVKRKSRSFEQLVDSADVSEELGDLLDDITPEVEDVAALAVVNAAKLALRFDIYEETDHGLIVAVPEGFSLDVGQYDDGYYFLSANNQKGDAGFTVDFGSHKVLLVSDEEGNTVLPSEDRYFAQALDQWMYDYCEESEHPCYYDDTSATVVDFGWTRKLLRFAYHTEKTENSELNAIDYYSINMLVNGKKIMQVESTINISQHSAVLQCWTTLTAQACGKPYWEQVSFMLAARLSSFTNLGVTTSETKLTELEYECGYCADESDSFLAQGAEAVGEPVTVGVPVEAGEPVAVGVPLEAGVPAAASVPVATNQAVQVYSVNYALPNGKWLFHLDKNKQWWVMQTEQWSMLSFIKYEQFNNKKYVQLRHEQQGLAYLVPYDGGVWYYWSNVGGTDQWVSVDTLQPNVKYEE